MTEANTAPDFGAGEHDLDQAAAADGQAGQEVARDPVVAQALGRVTVVHGENRILGTGHSGLYDAVVYKDYPVQAVVRPAA